MKKKLLYLFLLIPFLSFSQFNQGFEGATTIPAGWTVINGGDVDETWGVIDFTGGTVQAHTGTNSASISYSSAAHNDFLITPSITVAAGVNDQISFWGRSRDPLYPETIAVKLSTTTPLAASFTTTLAATVAPPSGSYYVKYSYDLSAYVGQTVYIGFQSTTTDKFVFDIDDVVSNALPACAEPSAVSATGVTHVAATIGWTSTATSFVVEYGVAGFTQGTGTIVNVTTGTSTSLSTLASNTVYTAYVKAVCSGTSQSAWSSVNFKTLPVPAPNDLCTTATPLTIGANFEANVVTGTTVGATTSATIPSCSTAGVNDVWYSLVVPADGNVTIQTDLVVGSENDDTIMAAFRGTCAALVAIPTACNDDNPDEDTLFSKLALTGLTPGETIYIGVWQYENIFSPAVKDQFKISAFSSTLGTGTFDTPKFTFYPNPVTDVLNLSYENGISEVTVFNILGQQVLQKVINANESQLNMAALDQGTYLVKVKSENETKIIKVLKK